MMAMEIVMIFAATAEDVKPGKWPEMVATKKIVEEAMRGMELPKLQGLADWCFWAKTVTECIEEGLVTGPAAPPAGCDYVIGIAKMRGLTVPVEKDPGKVLFE
jgi:hypothetical protein